MKLGEHHDFTINVKCNKDGKIISLEIVKKFKAMKKISKITILDSFLLLPISLSKLATVFNCISPKGIFPYKFIKAENINYIGNTPKICYFTNLSEDEYNTFCKSIKGNWDCKLETLKYLTTDLDILFEIMHKFNNTIFRKFKVNLSRIKTLSGLAFLIFSANFYNSDTKPIYFTGGKIEEFIRQGYYRGIVDVMTHYTD